ncbi:MAG: hypothetical protein M5U26_09945 [Planctomycetota bacterium]|nr:hypothetical protein [Planctomycetota bacterium]
MKRSHHLAFLLPVLALLLAACSASLPKMDSILDHPLLDHRVEETPRQKTLRECQQESERFRVDCKFCHEKKSEAEIAAPDKLFLTEHGRRARIMRSSPTFGLHNQCSKCHMTKFALNAYAKDLFGPESARFKEMQEELSAPVQGR